MTTNGAAPLPTGRAISLSSRCGRRSPAATAKWLCRVRKDCLETLPGVPVPICWCGGCLTSPLRAPGVTGSGRLGLRGLAIRIECNGSHGAAWTKIPICIWIAQAAPSARSSCSSTAAGTSPRAGASSTRLLLGTPKLIHVQPRDSCLGEPEVEAKINATFLLRLPASGLQGE